MISETLLRQLVRGLVTRVYIAQTRWCCTKERMPALTELIDDEKTALDVLENGLKKKKARTGEWNKNVSQ